LFAWVIFQWVYYLPGFIQKIYLKEQLKFEDDKTRELANFLTESYEYFSTGLREKSFSQFVENFSFQDKDIYESLCNYAERYFKNKYLIETIHRAKNVIKQFLPLFYKEFPFMVDISDTSHKPNQDRTHAFSLDLFGVNSDNFDYASSKRSGILNTERKDYIFNRRIADLITMVHEYAHGIYCEIVDRKNYSKNYYKTVNSSLNEGFAILVELLICDKLLVDSKQNGLNAKDEEDLKEWKKQRFGSLHTIFRNRLKERKENLMCDLGDSDGMAYVEGIIKIMHKYYKHGGEKEIIDFLHQIDPQKTIAMKRSDELYKSALKDPINLKIFL